MGVASISRIKISVYLRVRRCVAGRGVGDGIGGRPHAEGGV